MVWLVAAFVTGSVGMGASGAMAGNDLDHHAVHTQMDAAEGCPTALKSDMHGKKGHATCTMTACCFSEGPDLAILSPRFESLSAGYLPFAERRLTQSEPERAKKPPKYI